MNCEEQPDLLGHGRHLPDEPPQVLPRRRVVDSVVEGEGFPEGLEGVLLRGPPREAAYYGLDQLVALLLTHGVVILFGRCDLIPIWRLVTNFFNRQCVVKPLTLSVPQDVLQGHT